MADDLCRYDTVVVERTLRATPARVFQAWADPEQRRRWDVPEQGWVLVEHLQDFRVGGRERRRFGPPKTVDYLSDGRYLHIVPDRCIVSAGVMYRHGRPMTATLCTVEIEPHAAGTRLRLIDQSTYFGNETPANRKGGWSLTAERLSEHLDVHP